MSRTLVDDLITLLLLESEREREIKKIARKIESSNLNEECFLTNKQVIVCNKKINLIIMKMMRTLLFQIFYFILFFLRYRPFYIKIRLFLLLLVLLLFIINIINSINISIIANSLLDRLYLSLLYYVYYIHTVYLQSINLILFHFHGYEILS